MRSPVQSWVPLQKKVRHLVYPECLIFLFTTNVLVRVILISLRSNNLPHTVLHIRLYIFKPIPSVTVFACLGWVYLTQKKTRGLVFFTLLASPPPCLSPLDFNLQGRVLGGVLTIGCLSSYIVRRRAQYRADRFGQARGEHLC